MSLNNLATLNSTELEYFLDSFDTVLCDCDGVIWKLNKEIPGARESLSKLRQIGKQVRFVSNNCTYTEESFHRKLDRFQLDASIHDIAFPTLAIIAYLKRICFNKEIFLFGVPAMKQEFESAGFRVAKYDIDKIEERLEELHKVMQDDQEIGAVVVELDLNLNYIKLLKAAVYLKNPEVLFIVGGTDKKIPCGFSVPLIGPGHIESILENLTDRTALRFGKPGEKFNDFISERFDIKDPSRTLFIGDSMEQDMEFANKCSYQKLLVLSGVTSLQQAETCTNKNIIPHYYIPSLGDLHDLMRK